MKNDEDRVYLSEFGLLSAGPHPLLGPPPSQRLLPTLEMNPVPQTL